jgi:large conductance mechanosensitive channel
MIQEFKDFINKGNVVEAAVGLIMALAFLPVINSLVADVIMPVVGRIFGAPDFAELKIGLGGTEEVTLPDGTTEMREAAIYYGAFLNTVISFLIIALVVFLMVKAYNRATNVKEEEDGPSEVDLLTEIRDDLKSRS